MNKCSLAQISSIALWISVTIIFLTTWLVASAKYGDHEDSELGKGHALVTVTHPAFLITLTLFVIMASVATVMRHKECGKASEEMISSLNHSGFDML